MNQHVSEIRRTGYHPGNIILNATSSFWCILDSESSLHRSTILVRKLVTELYMYVWWNTRRPWVIWQNAVEQCFSAPNVGITWCTGYRRTYCHIFVYFLSNFVLQVEPSDDSSGNDVPVIISNSCDDIISSGMDDIKQVNDFLSYLTVLLLNFYLHDLQNSKSSVYSADLSKPGFYHTRLTRSIFKPEIPSYGSVQTWVLGFENWHEGV